MIKIKKKENMKLIKIKGNNETIVMRNICSYYPMNFMFLWNNYNKCCQSDSFFKITIWWRNK